MAYRGLQDFIAALDRAGELKRIGAQVDPKLEISAIADRIMREPGGGSALLFENVKGSSYPLAINLMGSERRMAMALDALPKIPAAYSGAWCGVTLARGEHALRENPWRTRNEAF